MINLPGIVAYYPLDGDAKDYSGNGYDGTWTGTEQYDTGIIGQAAKFDGNSAIKLNPLVTSFKEKTISLWFKTLNPNNSSAQGIYQEAITESSPFNGIQLWNGVDGIIVRTNYHNETKVCEKTEVAAEFGHFVMVYNSNELKCYFNGDLKVTISDTTDLSNLIDNVVLGANFENVHIQNLNGLVDNVYIFNRALSDDEVLQLYNEPFTKKQNLFCAFETTPDIDITMYDPNIKPKFVSDIIYTDYVKEEITDNSYTINNPNYKYADVYILINSGDISKNGEIVDSNCEGIYFYQKCVNNDKFEIKGDLNKIIVVYHNGYWSDLGDSSNG